MDRWRSVKIGLCAGLVAVAVASIQHRFRPAARSPHTTPFRVRVFSGARVIRPNYPYSVIAGGAYTPAELRSAIDRDPLVRQHYQGFNLGQLRLLTLTRYRYAFVSFRNENRFFWTHHRLRIPAGEVLITDGIYYAKTRCGNRISERAVKGSQSADVPDAALSSALDVRPVGLRFATPLRSDEVKRELVGLPTESPLLASPLLQADSILDNMPLLSREGVNSPLFITESAPQTNGTFGVAEGEAWFPEGGGRVLVGGASTSIGIHSSPAVDTPTVIPEPSFGSLPAIVLCLNVLLSRRRMPKLEDPMPQARERIKTRSSAGILNVSVRPMEEAKECARKLQ